MFLLSKLLLGVGTIASCGSLFSFLTPYYTGDKSTVYRKNSYSESLYNFEELDKASKERIKELQEWIKKFKSSGEAAKKSKTQEHQKSIQLLEKSTELQSSLKALYEKIETKIKELQTQDSALSQDLEEKLKLEAKFVGFKSSLSSAAELISLLNSWESSLSSMICAIKQETGCKTKAVTFLSKELISSENGTLQAQQVSSPSSGGGGVQETQGEQAKKVLAEAQKQFEELVKVISEINLKVQEYQMKIIWSELSLYPEWLKVNAKILWVQQHIQLLNRTIRKTNEQATEKVKEINETNDKLKKTYENYNKLKGLQATMHKFEQKFQEELLDAKSDLFRERVFSKEKDQN